MRWPRVGPTVGRPTSNGGWAECYSGEMQKQLINDALFALKKDMHLKSLITRYPQPEFDRGQKGKKPFEALIRAIVYQQLSGKAAGTILGRFLALYPKEHYPTPEALSTTSEAKLRSVGLSGQKAGYLHDLSVKFLDGSVNPRKFSSMEDEDIRAHIIAVKGVGPWTADMFLMFTLHRPDILPTGDLGIQKGFQRLFNLRTLPNPEKMKKLAEPWKPYRTIASWYLWRLADEPAH